MDYSFIRFSETLAEANQLKDSPLANIRYQEVIQLLPTEHYLQKTNTDYGISFDGDLQVLVVDCDDNTLADITDKVAVYEFIDRNGINQLDIEFYKLSVDFYKRPVHIKLVNTYSNAVYYSNSLYITAYESYKTTRFDYFNHNVIVGIPYDKTSNYQSIRLQLWFNNLEDKTEVSDYYQISNGNTISTRPLYKQAEIYACEMMSNFAFERINVLLLHDVIYIDGVRMTNKTTLKSGSRIQASNIFKTEFSCFKNYNENYLPYPFIYEPLSLVDRSPEGTYTLIGLPTKISGNFNRNITLDSGTIKLYKGVTLINTFTTATIIGNLFEVDITGLITTNGTYYVVISNGMFKSDVDTYSGTNWSFVVADGEYESSEYDNSQYLTN
jgi:hypothetical protein